MSTPGGLVDKQELIDAQLDTAHLGRVVNSKDASGAPISTSTNRTGGVNKTLDALEGEYEQSIANKEIEADAAIDAYRLLSKGPYAAGILLEDKFQYITYSGESYFAVNPPYTTTATLPDADGNLFISGYTTFENVANKIGNKNELSNSNFLTPSPDAIMHPNATPESYVAGTQIFSGVYAGDSGCTVTFIDGRVNCTVGDYQFKLPNTGGLERVPAFTSSVSDYDGIPKTTGVSHALVGDEYVVTVTPAAGDVFSVKFEQGSVATRHEVQSAKGLTYTFNTVAEMVASGVPVGSKVQWLGYYEISDGGSNWGVVKKGNHIEDGGSIFSINPTMYIEASLVARKLSALKFGVKRTNEETTERSQQFYNYCNENNITMYYPAGIYNHSLPINPNETRNYNTITLVGDSAGDAYGGVGVGGVTVFNCNGSDLFYQGEIYDENSSVSISKVKMFGIEVPGTDKEGWLFHVNSTTNKQLNNFWFTDVTFHLNAGIYKQTSATAGANAPYLTITRAYSWRTEQVVSLDANTTSTIFTIKDSLFHSTVSNAMDFLGGGELSLINVWFESCDQYAINSPNDKFFNLSMHNCDFENVGAIGDPSRRIWNVSANTRISITGKINIAFYQDSPPDLPANARLYNYSSRTISITASGGIVGTPDSIRLDRKSSSMIYVPFANYTESGSGVELFPDSLNGGVDGGVEYDTQMPLSMQGMLVPIAGSRVARGSATVPTPASDGWALLSFVFQGNSTGGGFNSGSEFTISGASFPFNTAINAPDDSDRKPYIAIQACPIVSAENITSVIADVRSRKFLSSPSFLFTESNFISDMLPLSGRKKSFKFEVTTFGRTMTIPLGLGTSFHHKVDINFPDGDGSATFHSSGKVGANEHRAVKVSDNTSSDITLTANTGNPTGSTSVGITNSSGVTKTAYVTIEF